jgi:tripartite-type tricarboxylate transporter receptor subunit TctC
MPACASAETAAAFFQGKQVRFYTMGSPGGGYDTYMRALIPHLERKLGARMLPTNEPGAGGLIAVNRTVNAPPDGLTILLVGGETLVTAQLYDAPGVNYDVRKLTWLARVSSEAKVALLGPKSPYASVADLVKSVTPVTWAGSSKIDGNTDFTAIMAHALGMKSKMIVGYKGTGDMNLAIQRGEVDGRVVSEESAALYGPSNGMRVVAVLARTRVEQFPDAPTLFESAKLAPAQARLIDWRASIAGLGRLMVVAPGTPPERVDLLQKTFAEIIRDPAFVAEAKKLSLSANHAGADEVRATVEQAMTLLDKAGLAEIRQIALERSLHAARHVLPRRVRSEGVGRYRARDRCDFGRRRLSRDDADPPPRRSQSGPRPLRDRSRGPRQGARQGGEEVSRHRDREATGQSAGRQLQRARSRGQLFRPVAAGT